MQIITRVREALAPDFPLRGFFGQPTIAGTASRLEATHTGNRSAQLLETIQL
jgi:hypothetical protein